MTSAIAVSGVSKHYGDVQALDDVTLEINDQEFFTLLGPSGCGKTTLLRIIAGFESISAGSVALFGEQIDRLPPNQRPVNTVFQQYSLFPHMTVEQNVRFGLEMKGSSSQHIRERTRAMLELVQLQEFAQRRSGQLSGGQQQRVALARALAPEPKVLLLDEPLSALDLKLRQAMRSELKQIQLETGITFVFVTHDQEEALTMSDRIAVMSQGRLQQVGKAEDIYREPANRFVADFIGEANFIDATLKEQGSNRDVALVANQLEIQCHAANGATAGSEGVIFVRPESIKVEAANNAHDQKTVNGNTGLNAVVKRKVFLGTDTQWVLELDWGDELVAREQNAAIGDSELAVGDRVVASIDPATIKFLYQ